ncbi:unnamed protein product [Closterium sp. Naga37s-1]|nr:unnamed protein product [Closterium sp. Naga37s-1]
MMPFALKSHSPTSSSSHPSLPWPAVSCLGVVLLQLLSGRISLSTEKTTPQFFRDTHLPTLGHSCLVRLARVGLACTAMPASTRLSLGRALAELEIMHDDLPPPVLASSSCALPLAPLLCQQVAMVGVLRATAGWAADRRIGSGGFGDVYRGVSPLDGCTPWAVKRARVLTNDFRREVYEMASKHHPHLVRLLGFCREYDASAERMEQIAIYEFMPHGDLHHRLHGDDATGGHHRLHGNDATGGLHRLHGDGTGGHHRLHGDGTGAHICTLRRLV